MKALTHIHFWSSWWPKDRTHKYRYCLHQTCDAVQTKEVLS